MTFCFLCCSTNQPLFCFCFFALLFQSGDTCDELSLFQTLDICTQFLPSTSGCINALTKKCTPSVHFLTECLLRNFFCFEVERQIGGRDLAGLCEIANHGEFVTEIVTGSNEGNLPTRCIKYFLSKFLLPFESEPEEKTTPNPLLLFKNKVIIVWFCLIQYLHMHNFKSCLTL